MISKSYIINKLERLAADEKEKAGKVAEILRIVDDQISKTRYLSNELQWRPSESLRVQYLDMPRITVERILNNLPSDLRSDPDIIDGVSNELQKKWQSLGGDKIAGSVLDYVLTFLSGK